MLASYLEDRQLMVEEGLMMDLSCGVPQGSGIFPLLWTLYYDSLLKMDVQPEVTIIGYADDVAVVTTGDSKDTIQRPINKVIKNIINGMDEHKLKIAPHASQNGKSTAGE